MNRHILFLSLVLLVFFQWSCDDPKRDNLLDPGNPDAIETRVYGDTSILEVDSMRISWEGFGLPVAFYWHLDWFNPDSGKYLTVRSDTTTLTYAIFRGLDDGAYKFYVAMKNNKGVIDASPASLSFRVNAVPENSLKFQPKHFELSQTDSFVVMVSVEDVVNLLGASITVGWPNVFELLSVSTGNYFDSDDLRGSTLIHDNVTTANAKGKLNFSVISTSNTTGNGRPKSGSLAKLQFRAVGRAPSGTNLFFDGDPASTSLRDVNNKVIPLSTRDQCLVIIK